MLLLIIGLISEGELFLLPLEVLVILLAIIAVLFVLVVLLFYQNKFDMTFTVDGRGVLFEVGRRQRRLNRIAIVLSLLFGSARTLGPALIAYSQETTMVRWRDVRHISVHRGSRVISLSNSWRVVMRLYCPPDIFEAARAALL